MAIGEFRSDDITVTLTNAVPAPLIATVPANEEWTLRWVRGVCLVAPGGTAPTISVGKSSAANEFCFNEVVSLPTASALGAKNVLGPDIFLAKPGTQIYARASANDAVRLTINMSREQVS